jgi:hypothetical protein
MNSFLSSLGLAPSSLGLSGTDATDGVEFWHGAERSGQGLTLVHFSAQPEPLLTQNTT